MKIGIVAAVYLENQDHVYFMEKTLASLKTSYETYLVLVRNFVDSLVEEDFIRICQEYKAKVLINPENNVSMAWNCGIANCIENGCEYILVPNLDVVLKSNCLDRLIEFAEQNKEYLVITASIWNDERTLESEDNEDEGVADSPHFSCFMVRKSFLDETGGFDENFKPAYAEDNDLHYRMKLLGLKACSIGKARFYHYGSRTIYLSNDPVLAEARLGSGNTRDYYLSKWGGLPGNEVFKSPFNDPKKLVKEWG